MAKVYELPVCPFCGNKVSITQHRNEYDRDKKTHVSIECKTCDLVMVAKSEKIITRKWFNRHIVKEHYEAIAKHSSKCPRCTVVLDNPDRWMKWCDERVLEENERLRKLVEPKASPRGRKCFCGHYEDEHDKYAGKGKNAKGSHYVCSKDGCSKWNLCDL